MAQSSPQGQTAGESGVTGSRTWPANLSSDPKPLVKKVKPNPKLPEEYVLDRSKVLDIITVIDNQGRQFEKTPKTYKDFDEEGLRDVILVSLNSLFEGKATGETFSHKGKTDIYLNIDKGNVLICECKIWGGQVLYHKAIEQLLGYLTWRLSANCGQSFLISPQA